MSAREPDSDLGPTVAIPEPFWTRRLRTLFRAKPACYEHKIIFESRALYETHWLREHYLEPKPGEGETPPVHPEEE